jgi:F-type H+-transporting ATPase subunit b
MGFLSLDGTFWVQIINFFIFYWILNIVYIKPASAALRERRKYIDSVINEYDAACRTAAELRAQADEKLAEGRREGEHLAATIRSEAMQRAEKLMAKAQAEFTQIVEEAQATAERETEAARAQADSLAKDLANDMLRRTIGAL